MTHIPIWAWGAFLVLGAWHGINPAMGWLFAVALGLQKQNSQAVWQSLLPLATGHVLSIGGVVALALIAGHLIPLQDARFLVAGLLLVFGWFRLFWAKHGTSGGMQVGFRDLTIWSFLTATAHGAGFMLLPVLLGMSGKPSGHPMDTPPLSGAWEGTLAVGTHTFGYLLVTGLIAWVVYRKIGLAILRRAWFNVDRVWAVSLILTACLTFLVGT
jgi:hypothetical protein